MAVQKLKPIEERDPQAAAVLKAFDDLEDDRADICPRCKGDGMDPWNDYLFQCPLCQGAGR